MLVFGLSVAAMAAHSAPFADWQLQHFGDGDAPEAQWFSDPDRDGRNNGEEFVFGTDPNLPSLSSGLFSLAPPDAGLSVTFVPAIDSGAVLRLRVSTDMERWTPVATRPLEGGPWAVHHPKGVALTDPETDEVTIAIPLAGEDRLFAELQIDIDGSVISDADGNGVPDSLDPLVEGIPAWQDSDGDGISDVFEILSERDPDVDERAAEQENGDTGATGLEVFVPVGTETF